MTSKIPAWAVPKKVVCIDLDGTLTEFVNSLDHIGKLKIGARKFLRHLKLNAFTIVVHTSRSIFQKGKIERYLKKNRVPFDEVVCGKPLAQFYIDDRAVAFKDNWLDVCVKINKVFPEVILMVKD